MKESIYLMLQLELCIGKDCKCPAIDKVPMREIEFLNDQSNEEKMRISPVDARTTLS